MHREHREFKVFDSTSDLLKLFRAFLRDCKCDKGLSTGNHLITVAFSLDVKNR